MRNFFRTKKIFMLVFTMVLLTVSTIYVFKDFAPREKLATKAANDICDTGYYLSGYAWSENVGWISMTGDGYGVSIDSATGNFSGYGWSENIGWVHFAPTDGFPDQPLYGAKMGTDNNVSGWASVLITKDNPGTTQGWVSMSGTGYGVKVNMTENKLSGFAWSEDYGWIDFGGVAYGCSPTISQYIYPKGISVYTEAETMTTGGVLSYNTGHATVGDIDNQILYKMVITNPSSINQSVDLRFTLPPGYKFQSMEPSVVYRTGDSMVNKSSAVTSPAQNATGNISFGTYNALPGESFIAFKVKSPPN